MRRAGLAFLIYLAAASWMTWPLASAPSRIGTPNLDAYGNLWTLAWVVHQAARDPLHLFDANMFYPWSGSLAYAESLLPQALQAAPILALGGSPLLAYNVVFLLSFGLCGLGAYLLAEDLSGSPGAGFLAGIAYAFCSHRWHHIVHLQSLSTQWLPFALLCARRAVTRGGLGNLIGLGLFSLLQILSSGYFSSLLALAVGITLLYETARERVWDRLLPACAAMIVAASAALPVFLQYRAVQRRHGWSRGNAEAIHWSASAKSYLEPGPYSAAPHLDALHQWARDGQPLYPGTWPIAFGAWGLLLAWRGDRAARLAAVFVLLGVALSLGPELRLGGIALPGPFRLFKLLPGGALLRTPSRLGLLAILGVDVLAAMAWAHVLRARPYRWAWTAVVGVMMAVEANPGELRGAFRELPAPPPATRWLASAQRGALLELPWNEPADGALYLYWSTVHWLPLVNGYGGFAPPGNFGLGLLGNRWPSPYSARVFRGDGIRYVLLHTELLKPGHRERLAHATMPDGVALVASFGGDRIYEIDPAGEKEKPSETEGSSANPR